MAVLLAKREGELTGIFECGAGVVHPCVCIRAILDAITFCMWPVQDACDVGCVAADARSMLDVMLHLLLGGAVLAVQGDKKMWDMFLEGVPGDRTQDRLLIVSRLHQYHYTIWVPLRHLLLYKRQMKLSKSAMAT